MDRAKRIRRARLNSFTLVELLVSMAVLVMMVGLLAQVLSSSQMGLSYLGNSAQRRQNACTVLANMAKDLRASLKPVNRSYEGADPLTGQFQLLINPPGVPIASGLSNPNTIFWSEASPNSVGGTGLVGYVVRWGTSSSGAPQPLLCRLFLNTAQTGPQLANIQANMSSPFQWASTSLVATYASADLNNGYQGWLADNVLALYVRALDPTMAPVTKYARSVSSVTAITAITGNNGGLQINLGALAGVSSVNQFDSRQGYQYVSGSTTNNVYGPALPAAIEIAIVAAEPRDISRLPHTLPASAYATNGYVAANDMWTNINAYMAGLPSSLKKNARVYSTIVTP